jgi:hypothetical protein
VALGSWAKLSDIDDEASSDYSGTSVSLSASADGTRVVIGAIGNSVRVFEYQIHSGEWSLEPRYLSHSVVMLVRKKVLGFFPCNTRL